LRLVHISDLHLGFRQFQRLTPTGINQREADVAAVFRKAVDAIIELRPDLILFAGDVFHAVRPPNPAILHAFSNVSRLVAEVPEAVVVMIAGNHDKPRALETGCILRLFRQLGVHVVDAEPRTLQFPERGLSILAVPDVQESKPTFAIDPSFAYNVLVVHGEVRGIIPRHAAADDRPTLEIDPDELRASTWSYTALGHYHVYHEVAPNAFYSGATEYTSSNPWGELREEKALGIPGKGFIEFDLDSGAHTFHPIPGIRAFVDLPRISARGLTSIEVDELIARSVDACEGGIDEKVVRLVVRDVPRHIARELDHGAIRAHRRRALQFLLDTRRPDVARPHGQGAPGPRRSLEDTVREKLNARLLESNIDRQALIDLGIGYLREAEAADAARVEAEA
jgi:DNA repair exonuclease SbcCD nuclease subunit